MLTLDQVQTHFVTPLTPAEIARYQARLDLVNQVDWVDGAYYAIGDAEDPPDTYPIYECAMENGIPYLGSDTDGYVQHMDPAYFVVYAGCAIIPQR